MLYACTQICTPINVKIVRFRRVWHYTTPFNKCWGVTRLIDMWDVVSHYTTPFNKSCRTYQWVVSHLWIGRVVDVKTWCDTYESVVSLWKRGVAMRAWCRYESVVSLIWVRGVTHMSASCDTYECVVWHIWVRGVTHINRVRGVRHMHKECGVTHMSAWCDTYQ